MKYLTITLLCLAVGLASAQTPTITSTFPVDNATSVPVGTTTISMTFNVALDTTTFAQTQNGPSGGVISNIDAVHGISFSPDHRTVNVSVTLSAGKAYFFCIFRAKNSIGTPMASPFVYRFTTGASFPAFSVSGNVSGGSTGVSPAFAMVVVSRTPIQGNTQDFVSGAVADGAGAFTIPYVGNDTLYTVAAKDANADGDLDPSSGDAIGFGPTIVVNGANVTGVAISFQVFVAKTYKEALDSLNAHSGSFSNPHTLRSIQGSQLDSIGRGNWEFSYTTGSRQTSFRFRVNESQAGIEPLDSSSYDWVSMWKPIAALPTVAAVDSFFARGERNGGYAYRPVPSTWNGFDVYLQAGDLTNAGFWDLISDTSKPYLGLTYWYGIQGQNQSTLIKQRRSLGDYLTGNILATTGISEGRTQEVPAAFSLAQNYPNPFNPSTVISYALPAGSRVRLDIYNLLGQKIASLVDGYETAGVHSVEWRPTVASGMYFYRLDAVAGDNAGQRFSQVRRMLLVK